MKMYRVPRPTVWSIFAIGVVLIAIPFATGLPSKASAGHTLLHDLHPLMQPTSVNKTVDYYDKTFVPMRPVAVVARKASQETPKLLAGLAAQLHMTPAQLDSFLGTSFPATASLLEGLPKLAPIFEDVSPGLTHYQPLIKAISGSVGNFAQVDSLPDLRLFTWILVIPGGVLVLIAGGSLVGNRRRRVAPIPHSAAT
jgi:hypothetical protein